MWEGIWLPDLGDGSIGGLGMASEVGLIPGDGGDYLAFLIAFRTITEGDAFAPPLPAATYDVVLGRHVLWALPDPVEVGPPVASRGMVIVRDPVCPWRLG